MPRIRTSLLPHNQHNSSKLQAAPDNNLSDQNTKPMTPDDDLVNLKPMFPNMPPRGISRNDSQPSSSSASKQGGRTYPFPSLGQVPISSSSSAARVPIGSGSAPRPHSPTKHNELLLELSRTELELGKWKQRIAETKLALKDNPSKSKITFQHCRFCLRSWSCLKGHINCKNSSGLKKARLNGLKRKGTHCWSYYSYKSAVCHCD